MKRRFLALALALVMVVGLLPAMSLTANAVIVLDSEYDIEETNEDLSTYTNSYTDNVDVAEGGISATISGELTHDRGGFVGLEKKNIFASVKDEYIILDLSINEMPVFSVNEGTDSYDQGSAHAASGFFLTCTRNYIAADADAGTAASMDYIKIAIVRTDDEGNLSFAISKSKDSSTLDTPYPLGKKVGDNFKLMAHWHEDGCLDIYCDGTLVHSYDATATYVGTYSSSRKHFLRIGYGAYGAAVTEAVTTMNVDIDVNSLSLGTKVAHTHVEGTPATCSTLAVCSACGEAYGTTAAHTESTPATCSTKAVCSVCGQAYGLTADHTPDAEGNCTVCFAATGYKDLSGATLGNKSEKLFTLTQFGASVTNAALALNTSSSSYTSDYSAVLKQVFTTSDVTAHVSQTITITAMPVFETAADVNAYTGQGYYNNLRRNYDSSAATVDSVMYYIFPDVDGNLNLWIKDDSAWTSLPLNRELGDTFRLTTAWHTDNKVSFYCDGSLIATYENATTNVGHQSKHYSAFTMGFSSRGATADDTVNSTVNVNMSVTNVVISETHSGGNATCTEQAKCDYCGEAYGDLGYHVGGSATCTTKPTCDVCGEAYGIYADHTPNAEGICSVCGAATGYMDLEVEDRVSLGKNSTTLMTLSKFGAAINASNVTLRTTAGSDYSAVLKSAFIVPDVAQHISQTINITAMPVFDGATLVNAYTGSGYYNNLRRNQRTELVEEVEKALVDYAMYSIYPDASGNLMLGVYSSSGWVYESLNRGLNTPFRIDTVWHVDGSLSIYCDGYLVITVADATTYGVGTQGDHYAAFTMGYSSYGANEAAYGTGAVNMSVSNIVITNGHTEVDDGSCLTGTTCSVCGTTVKEGQANHVQPEDDGNCVTPVKCSNPGCTHVFVEGHTLTHVPEDPATNEATGTKEHWKCETDGNLYLDEAGTQKVTEGELVISPNFEVSGDKSTVSDDYVNDAITDAGEGDVALEVSTPEVEMSAAALDALVAAGNPLVITTGEGKVTLNPAAIAAINTAAAENALSINVKKAGTSVLVEDQTNKLLETYTVVKDVITAEMTAGSAITTFGEGTVAIEIPFTLDDGTVASDYKLVYISDDAQTVEVITNAVFADNKVTATLTHFSDYAIVYTGEVPEEPVEGNTTITTNGGSSFATVTGTYVDGDSAGTTFSVAVEWGNLEFFYDAANTWNPETHTNDGGGWRAGQKGNVKVTNHSNVAVTVTVTKDDVDINGTNTNLGVDFVDVDGNTATGNLIAGPEGNPEGAQSFTVEFTPRGTLDDTAADGITLATITVRIEKYDEEAQN